MSSEVPDDSADEPDDDCRRPPGDGWSVVSELLKLSVLFDVTIAFLLLVV